MGRLKNGLSGPVSGKIGGTVYYVRLGQQVSRAVPHASNKPKTKKQLIAQAVFATVNEFITTVNPVTNVGFKPKSKKTPGRTANNEAMSANLKTVVEGVYPDFSINYSKIIVSEGRLPLPENITVVFENGTLQFTWQNQTWLESLCLLDQAMLLAYFPETNRAAYAASSNRRADQQDSLHLHLNPRNFLPETYVEVYIAFVSDDRENVSDSLYLGRIEVQAI